MKIGIIGCGKISDIYLKNLTGRFLGAEVFAVADLVMERAEQKAKTYNVKALNVDELLKSEIDIVLNLTIPKAHAEINTLALNAGKHVYVEKPFARTLREGEEVLELAKEKGLCVGCAPDTFLGDAIQTAKQLILSGKIGEIVGGAAFMMCRGHENWHPDPEFYYSKEAGGPMFDMGPYYMTALTYLLGGIKKVTGISRASFSTRTIAGGKKKGQTIEVETPTHVTGTMQFENGSIANIITSFDAAASNLPHIEIYGSKATLSMPDPNGFGGKLKICYLGDKKWKTVKLLSKKHSNNCRGLGLIEMADAIKNNREPLASGARALHILESFEGMLKASETGEFYNMTTTLGADKS